jgi:signal transduction histidine kinase
VDFRFTELNTPAEHLLARSAHEVIGKTQLEIAPSSHASGTIDKMISIVTTGVPIQEQVKIAVPGISANWIHRQMVRLGDGLVASARDITTQKQNEASLAEARDLIAAVLEAASDAFVMCAPDGQIMLTNRAACTFFDICEEGLSHPASLSLAQMFRQVEDAPAFLDQLGELLDAPEREMKGEIEVRGAQERTLVWTSSPVRGENTAILGRVLVFRDASKDREADRFKTDFIGRVSHELRTPLTSIKGFVELILEGDAGPITEEVRDFLSIANDSTELLISIVNDILDVTRIDAHKVMLDRRLVDVKAIARHVAQTLQPLITSRHQHLAIDIPPDLPPVYADAERLNQIMINLINNAHKYTPPGGSIKVWARTATAADLSYLAPNIPNVPMAVIGVVDTGVGIAAGHQERIFQRFYRVGSLATQEAGGTGLGLSIVRSLVELHGGAIWVESAEDQGSTFAFLLPTMLVSQARPAITATP